MYMYICMYLYMYAIIHFLLPSQIPPLRIKKNWYQLSKSEVDKLAQQVGEMANQLHQNEAESRKAGTSHRKPSNFTHPYSDYESRYGRYSDPLYSRHAPNKRPCGLDPNDPEYVYVDPHVMATPTIADTNGDNKQDELVVPVSYFFDPFAYGDSHRVDELGGMEPSELVDYVAAGVVVIDLKTGKVLKQKLLGITRVSDGQPGYALATPTVARLVVADSDTSIIIGTTMGELHVLNAESLEEQPGFPIFLDSISAQVAVADVFKNGALVMVVGDASGNVYCIDKNGQRLWERDGTVQVISAARFANVDLDDHMEVIVISEGGDLFVLKAETGEPYFRDYPMHLQASVQGSVLPIHLDSRAENGVERTGGLSMVIPAANTLYVVDGLTSCIDKFETQHILFDVLADDIDPYETGLELLAISLDGYMVCFSTATKISDIKNMSLESWPGGQNGFVHKTSSFGVIFPQSNWTLRDIVGGSFTLEFQIVEGVFPAPRQYWVTVSVGRKHVLYQNSLVATQKQEGVSINVPTPPTPMHAFLTITVCNRHLICITDHFNTRFNLHFEDNLKWFLALPFLSLCAMVLWIYRDADIESLPLTARPSPATSRKDL